MTIARIENDAIAEVRDLAIEAVPEHKREFWREVPEKPEVDLRIEHAPVTVFNGGLISWTRQPRDLAEVKAAFKARVETDAEAQRLLYITSGSGMAMTYQEKKEQALAVIDLGSDEANALANNGIADYPLLAASVGIEAPTLYQAAELIMDRYEAWATLCGAIERQRLAAKKAIDDAPDVAAVKAAYEAIQW